MVNASFKSYNNYSDFITDFLFVVLAGSLFMATCVLAVKNLFANAILSVLIGISTGLASYVLFMLLFNQGKMKILLDSLKK